jgi:hypothetical protein
VDISEGNVVTFDLYPLGEMILKKDSLTAAIICSIVDYVETVPCDLLKRNITGCHPISCDTYISIKNKKSTNHLRNPWFFLYEISKKSFHFTIPSTEKIGKKRTHSFFTMVDTICKIEDRAMVRLLSLMGWTAEERFIRED